MQVKYGSGTVVVASSPKMAEEFLKTHDSVFASRPPLASGKYTGYNFQDMTWAPAGPHWRKARKVYLTEIFTPKRLNSFEYIRVEERQRFLSGLYAKSGTPVVLKNEIRRYTLSSISRVVLRDKYFSDHKTDTSLVSISEFHGMIDEWMVLNGVINIGDWIPWLRVFDLQGYVKRMKVLRDKFDAFHNYVIADHIAQKKLAGKDFVPKDMVDVLLQLSEDGTDPEVKLTIEAVKALVH
ncbi:Cytochrome p450, partial [Thalictrum thalictroides]